MDPALTAQLGETAPFLSLRQHPKLWGEGGEIENKYMSRVAGLTQAKTPPRSGGLLLRGFRTKEARKMAQRGDPGGEDNTEKPQGWRQGEG